MNYKEVIDELKLFEDGTRYDTEYTDYEVFTIAIKALEKQIFFENTVGAIHDWFVDNKDCLLDDAKIVATNKFIEDNVDGYIDDVDLDFIVEDIVDKLQEGILNVLSTFKEE